MAASSALGLGLAPMAPRTFGTLGGVAIAWGLSGSSNFLLYALLAALGLYVLGRIVEPWVEARAGADPDFFVLDEVVGYLVAIAWTGGPTPLALLAAFVLFRFFDIIKPPPAQRLERVRGGDGLLLDDLVAGAYALAAMVFLRLVFLEPASWDISLAPVR